MKSECPYDVMTILDGVGKDGEVLLDRTCGNNIDVDPVASSGRSLTLYFHSDNSDSDNSEFDGLDLTVTLIYNLNEMAGITDAINNALKGKTVNIAFSRTFEKLSDGEGKA